MKKRNPYFNFYPADFMNGVRGLSAQEVGVYTMLLCRIYEEDGPVEYHVRRLSTFCGMREATFEKVVETLVDLGKVTLENGHLSNARAEAEISKRSHGLEIASRAGKISAEKRQQKQQEAPTPLEPTFNHTDTDTDTEKKEREPNGSPKKIDRGSRLPDDWSLPDDWQQEMIGKGLDPGLIRSQAERFKNYWIGKAGKDAVKVNWLATWRNWMAKHVEEAVARRRPGVPAGSDWWGGRDL